VSYNSNNFFADRDYYSKNGHGYGMGVAPNYVGDYGAWTRRTSIVEEELVVVAVYDSA
jgi:hypothetical protein